MRKRSSGTPVFFNTEKLLKHMREKLDMGDFAYNDEYHGDSKIMYDGELIDFYDAVARMEKDDERQELYEEAENSLDENQMTWSDVENTL